MADTKQTNETKQTKTQYLKDVVNFYLTPHPRTLLTLFFVLIYGYCVLYYFDDAHLAERFLVYTIFSGTALLSIGHLFWYVCFIVTLIFPFLASGYSIFALYEAWHKKRDWDAHFRTLMTIVLIVVSIFLIVFMNSAARIIARQDVLRGFVEDNNLVGRI